MVEAIAAEVPMPAPAPDAPHMFRCAADGCVSAWFEGAGLHDVSEWDVGLELVTDSTEQYWEMMRDHVSLAAAALARVDAAGRERIRERVTAAVAPFVDGGRVRVPGVARCIVGTRPAA